MANKKISELATATALTGTELVELVQGGANKKTTVQEIADLGGSGSGTVNSGTQYRLGYYAATGTAISEAAAITASRALKSDANGVPTHFDTSTEPSLTELSYVKGVTSAIQTQLNQISIGNKLIMYTNFI